MKKLLSLLTITTLTASIPAPLLANTVLTRVKRDVSTLSSNSNNDYLPPKENIFIPKDIVSFTVVGKGNIYYLNVDFFVLKHGATTPVKINGINDKINDFVIAVDTKNNIYFGTTNSIYVLNDGSDTATKINDINASYITKILVDSKNNIYFMSADGAFVLKQGETKPKKINIIVGYLTSIAVDSKDNVYFGTKDGAYKLTAGSTTAKKIDEISKKFIIDSNDNIYFGTKDGAYKLSAGSTTPTKINGIAGFRNIAVDSNNNIYFGTSDGLYKLKHGETTPTKIDGINFPKWLSIDSKDNIYFGTDDSLYILQTVLSWTKTQSKFTLVESTKTQTWTRPDLLSVDGEVNIDIANPNIDKVVFDNVQQRQTNKHWTINVKPETAPRDHNLQVMFTLDGKQYTSEIIVSMQAKIDPTPTPARQNLGDLIKTTDLGNIIENNDNTIFTAVNQKNGNVIDDFSQIEIINKTDTQATLTAKKDSKSYKGSVDVSFNVVPATTVDLKIDVTPTSSKATVIKDYLGQIDTSNLTNPVNTFYYANSESVITMVKPTPSSVITGVIYGCDERWNKTSQSSNIDPSNGIKIDGSQLATTNGKYVVELSDNLGHTNNVYLQINKDKKDIKEYWNTDNGKQFEQWAEDNGEKNIRGSSASQLNNLFEVSKTWKQSLAHLDFKLDDFVVDNIKNVTQDEIDTYKTKMLASVKAQVEKYAPDVVENTDYAISVDNLVVGDWTASKDVKVQSVDGSTKLLSFAIKTIPVHQKEQPIPPTPTPDNEKTKSFWKIVGIVAGSLVGVALVGMLVWRYWLRPWRTKIRNARSNKRVAERRAQRAKEEAKAEQENKESEDKNDDGNNS